MPDEDAGGFATYPREIVSKYVIGRELGKGAFGKVFHGSVKATGDTVAIKFVQDVFLSAMDARCVFLFACDLFLMQCHAKFKNCIRVKGNPISH